MWGNVRYRDGVQRGECQCMDTRNTWTPEKAWVHAQCMDTRKYVIAKRTPRTVLTCPNLAVVFPNLDLPPPVLLSFPRIPNVPPTPPPGAPPANTEAHIKPHHHHNLEVHMEAQTHYKSLQQTHWLQWAGIPHRCWRRKGQGVKLQANARTHTHTRQQLRTNKNE